MTHDAWLAGHSYLQPLASFHNQVNSALDEILTVSNRVPAWADYENDFDAGVPLLQSSRSTIDLGPAKTIIKMLLEKLATTPLPEPTADQIRTLHAELSSGPDAPQHAVAWLLYDAPFAFSYPGLLRYLGWTTLSRHLHPLTQAFGNWRTEERWLRSYCPTCGSLPVMAQLAGKEAERHRLLSCGCCGTRWWYQRMDCPFCEKQNNHQLAALTVEGENALRIDYCESCHGYLKTYNGEGNEAVFLADWTSIHLDVAAQTFGLKRLAPSLFAL